MLWRKVTIEFALNKADFSTFLILEAYFFSSNIDTNDINLVEAYNYKT